jgi:hypothetical protein
MSWRGGKPIYQQDGGTAEAGVPDLRSGIDFMGRQSENPSDDEICENWIGPRGEAVYYLHRIDRDDFKTYAGGDPIRRKSKDAGRVYFGLTKPNAYWLMVALLSVEKRFPRAEIRLLTRVDDPRITQRLSPETPQSIVDVQYILPRWRRRRQALQQTLNIDYGNRFQCKLALGFGHAIFGAAFADRPHESVLREGLWRRPGNGAKDAPRIAGRGSLRPRMLVSASFSPILRRSHSCSLGRRKGRGYLRSCPMECPRAA